MRAARLWRGPLSYSRIILSESMPRNALPGVDHQARIAHHGVVVHGRVVGDDNDAIGLGKRRLQIGRQELVAIQLDAGDKGIAESDHCAALLQQVHHVQGRGLANIINIALVGDAQTCES